MNRPDLQKKFPTIEALDYEIKRIASYKRRHRFWARWGNEESKDKYQHILRYEKDLKSLKQTYKNKQS